MRFDNNGNPIDENNNVINDTSSFQQKNAFSGGAEPFQQNQNPFSEDMNVGTPPNVSPNEKFYGNNFHSTTQNNYYNQPQNPMPVYRNDYTVMRSTFTGSTLEHVGWLIGLSMASIFTAYLLTPLVHCQYLDWKTKNTVIDGQRLKFTGTIGDFYVKCLIWVGLSIITLGIYSFFVPIKYNEWVVQNTIFDN